MITIELGTLVYWSKGTWCWCPRQLALFVSSNNIEVSVGGKKRTGYATLDVVLPSFGCGGRWP